MMITIHEENLFYFPRFLFLQLKGSPSSQVPNEVQEMIKEVGLEGKGKTQSNNLSGGQKRKLSVGIALISGSKVRFDKGR